MAKTKVRKALAEQKALGIHMLYPDVCTFPVNPIRVANRLGYVVYKDNSTDTLDGRWDAKEGAIYLNTEQSMNRRRFTVCHELGHALMGHSSSPRNNAKTYSMAKYDPAEVEANIFAACLLMPAEEVWKCINKGMSFDGMTKYFGVSESALGIRLTQLGYVSENWKTKN